MKRNTSLIVMMLTICLFVSQAWARGSVHVLVSVDWEGRDLTEANLKAMEDFRNQFPKLGLLQFLNAAYYTKSDVDHSDVTRKIARVLRPQDELGLHIHGWKSLFEAAGVTYQSQPTFWGGVDNDCRRDCGHQVPLHLYSKDELRKVIHFSVETLNSHGFGRATSFRSGGWIGAPLVLQALVEEGFVIDSSAVPPPLLTREIGATPLWRWVDNLWHDVKTSSQPTKLQTPSGFIWEVPDNGALADYRRADEMVEVYENAIKRAKRSDEDIIVHIGFHQETASYYVNRVAEALKKMYALAEKNNMKMEFVSLPVKSTLH